MYWGYHILNALPFDVSYKYKWSTGDTTSSIYVWEAGNYIVDITDKYGLHYNDTILIKMYPKPETKILHDKDTLLSKYDLISLNAFPIESGSIFEWSTGETASSIQVNKEGLYI